MSTTTPGDTDKTAVTNAATHKPGWPAETVDGRIIFIVKKRATANLPEVLVDEDDVEHVIDDNSGKLIEAEGRIP